MSRQLSAGKLVMVMEKIMMNQTGVYIRESAKKTWLMLGMAGIISGCSLNELDTPVIVSEVRQEFSVEMRELPGPEPRKLQFWVQTIEPPDCAEADIRYDFWPTPGRFRLDIAGVSKPANCQPATEPVLEMVDLGVLSNGDYQVGINLRNTITNQGLLSRSNASYTLQMNSEQGIKIKYRQLLRIPPQTIWGYVAYGTPAMGSVASAFINELNQLAPNVALSPGNYGHFWVPSGNSQVVIQESPEALTQRTFVGRYSGNMDDLQALVQAYRLAHGSMLEIRLMAITGEVL